MCREFRQRERDSWKRYIELVCRLVGCKMTDMCSGSQGHPPATNRIRIKSLSTAQPLHMANAQFPSSCGAMLCSRLTYTLLYSVYSSIHGSIFQITPHASTNTRSHTQKTQTLLMQAHIHSGHVPQRRMLSAA